MNKQFISKLEKLNACRSSIEWLQTQDNLEQAWKDCERGDWLLWLVARLGVDKRKLFLAKGLVAKQVIHLMDDKRSIDAVNAAIDYGNGKISKDEFKIFTADADDASADADADDASADNVAAYAAYAAYAAANDADDDNDSAAYAAASAADAADAYAYAANADDDDDAYVVNLSLTGRELLLIFSAEIVREVFTFEEVKTTLHIKLTI